MFSRKRGYLKIEKIYYKALKIIYNNNEAYDELLARSNEVSIHQKHLRALATEILSLADINPDFIKPYLIVKEMPYNLQNGCTLKLPLANSILFRACLL